MNSESPILKNRFAAWLHQYCRWVITSEKIIWSTTPLRILARCLRYRTHYTSRMKIISDEGRMLEMWSVERPSKISLLYMFRLTARIFYFCLLLFVLRYIHPMLNQFVRGATLQKLFLTQRRPLEEVKAIFCVKMPKSRDMYAARSSALYVTLGQVYGPQRLNLSASTATPISPLAGENSSAGRSGNRGRPWPAW